MILKFNTVIALLTGTYDLSTFLIQPDLIKDRICMYTGVLNFKSLALQGAYSIIFANTSYFVGIKKRKPFNYIKLTIFIEKAHKKLINPINHTFFDEVTTNRRKGSYLSSISFSDVLFYFL